MPPSGVEPGADALIKVAPRRTRGPLSAVEGYPGFGLHGVAVLGGADTQPLLDHRIEVADRDAAHGYRGFTCLYELIIIYDCVEINDSVAERRGAALKEQGIRPGSECEPWPQEVPALDFHGRKSA